MWHKRARPSTLDEDDFEDLQMFFNNNPKKSVNEAIAALEMGASRATVNRKILEKGLRAYRAPKKFYIRSENIQKRFEFAIDMSNKGVRYWRTVIFSDESSFQLMNTNGRVYIRRFAEEQDLHGGIKMTSQCETLMVWGAISSRGVGPLMRIDSIEEDKKTLNGPRYLKLLQRYLTRNYPGLKEQRLTFQQDNAPPHRYGKVASWLEEREGHSEA